MRLMLSLLMALFAFYAQANEHKGDSNSSVVQKGDNEAPNGARAFLRRYDLGNRQIETTIEKTFPSSMQNPIPEVILQAPDIVMIVFDWTPKITFQPVLLGSFKNVGTNSDSYFQVFSKWKVC